MNARRVLVAIPLAFAIAGCVQAGGEPQSASSAPTAPSDAPDADVTRVSLTSATGLAADGITACGVAEKADQIRGIGVLAHATLLPRYVALTGREPEIKSDDPVFVVLFSGSLRLALRGGPGSAVYTDIESPTCVFMNGGPIWYGTGPWVDSNGNKGTPEPAPLMDRELPAPLP